MFVPNAVSSISLPCSAINLHCEQPWLNSLFPIVRQVKTKRVTLSFMAIYFNYKSKKKRNNTNYLSLLL